jgi:hypothetical protein
MTVFQSTCQLANTLIENILYGVLVLDFSENGKEYLLVE